MKQNIHQWLTIFEWLGQGHHHCMSAIVLFSLFPFSGTTISRTNANVFVFLLHTGTCKDNWGQEILKLLKSANTILLGLGIFLLLKIFPLTHNYHSTLHACIHIVISMQMKVMVNWWQQQKYRVISFTNIWNKKHIFYHHLHYHHQGLLRLQTPLSTIMSLQLEKVVLHETNFSSQKCNYLRYLYMCVWWWCAWTNKGILHSRLKTHYTEISLIVKKTECFLAAFRFIQLPLFLYVIFMWTKSITRYKGNKRTFTIRLANIFQ